MVVGTGSACDGAACDCAAAGAPSDIALESGWVRRHQTTQIDSICARVDMLLTRGIDVTKKLSRFRSMASADGHGELLTILTKAREVPP